MKNRKKKNHAKKRKITKENRPHTVLADGPDGTKKYLIIEDWDNLSTSGILEAEPVPFETRKKCIRFTLLLLAAVWVLFLRFVPLHVLLRILVLIVLTLLINQRIFWEAVYRNCTGQTLELQWTLSEDALLLGSDRIPYETIHEIRLYSTEEVLKRHQPGVYLSIMTETDLIMLFSRRTGTESEIKKSEDDVTAFCALLTAIRQAQIE